jgi:hypothetical protein
MRTSSLIANARLTHAHSSFTAAPGPRPAAERTLSLLGHEGTRSYLSRGRPAAPSHSIGRQPSWAGATTHMNPHPRDIQESAR